MIEYNTNHINSESTIRHQPKHNRSLGIILQLIGGLGFLLTSIIYLYTRIESMSMSWLLTLLVNSVMAIFATGSFLLFSRGRQLAAQNAYMLQPKDLRPPIVYLRSFIDDEPFTASQLTPLFGIPGLTEEQMLTKVLSKFGPFVAIGSPLEQLPTLGAARMYVNDFEWRDTIDAIFKRAALVLLRTGETDGFWWEVQRVCEIVPPEKILFFLRAKQTSLPAAESQYLQFMKRANKYVPKPLPEHLEGANFLAFSKDWTPFLLTIQGSSVMNREEDLYTDCLCPVLKNLGFNVSRRRGIVKSVIIYLLIGFLASVSLIIFLKLLLR